MNPAVLLMIILTGGGFWYGGTSQEILVRWTSPKGMPAAELRWVLALGEVELAKGKTAMLPGEDAVRVELAMPEVRSPVGLEWSYQLIGTADAKVLETGRRRIELFPRDHVRDWGKALGSRKLAVLDSTGALCRWLDQESGVSYQRIGDLGKLALSREDLLLIAEDELASSPLDQGGLLKAVEGGANALVLAQRKPETLAALALTSRRISAAAELQWNNEHRLLQGLAPALLESLGKGEIRALVVPRGAQVLELAWWPHSAAGAEAMECALAIRQLGRGRMVLCQFPLENPSTDPRSAILLSTALQYLAADSGPIVPWDQRRPVLILKESVAPATIDVP